MARSKSRSYIIKSYQSSFCTAPSDTRSRNGHVTISMNLARGQSDLCGRFKNVPSPRGLITYSHLSLSSSPYTHTEQAVLYLQMTRCVSTSRERYVSFQLNAEWTQCGLPETRTSRDLMFFEHTRFKKREMLSRFSRSCYH